MTTQQLQNIEYYKISITMQYLSGKIDLFEETLYNLEKMRACYLLHEIDSGEYYQVLFEWCKDLINQSTCQANKDN